MISGNLRRIPWLAVLVLLLGCTADLRPDTLAARVRAQDEAAGRAALERASQVLHATGATPWAEQPGVEVHLTDDFVGLVGNLVRFWPEDPQEMVIRFVPTKDSGVVELKGEETILIGKHNEKTWRKEGDEPVEYDEDDDTVFWLPTLQYFLEIPFRLGEGEIVDHGGEVDLDGVACDLIYITWGSYGPNDNLDQYLAYARKDDGRIVRVDFTVRDMLDSIVATVVYSDFKETEGGYTLPHTIQIGEDPPDDLLHTITVHSYQTIELDESVYAPPAGD